MVYESDRLSGTRPLTFLTGLLRCKAVSYVNLVCYIQFQCEFNLYMIIKLMIANVFMLLYYPVAVDILIK